MAHTSTILKFEVEQESERARRQRYAAAPIGALAEALLYYDRVILFTTGPEALLDLCRSFGREGLEKELIKLFDDRILVPLYHSWIVGTQSIGDDVLGLRLIRPSHQPDKSTIDHSFESRILGRSEFAGAIGRKHYLSLARSLSESYLLADSIEFDRGLRNAEADVFDGERCRLYLQTAYDQASQAADVLHVPSVKAVSIADVTRTIDGQAHAAKRLKFKVEGLPTPLPTEFLRVSPAHVLTHAGDLARRITCAMVQDADLWETGGDSSLVCDKLFESIRAPGTSATEIVHQLEAKVDFPRIGPLVESGRIGFGDVLSIRKEAQRFREWLQSEADKDRDAVVAYHEEIGKSTGLNKFGKSALTVSIAAAIASIPDAPPILGASLGAIGSEGVQWLAEIARRNRDGWRPAVFGRWYADRIEALRRQIPRQE